VIYQGFLPPFRLNYYMNRLICLAFVLICFVQARSQIFTHASAKKQANKAWRIDMPRILQQINPPVFSSASVTITSTQNFKETVQHTIDSLSNSGGGKISIAAGEYLSNGPLHLKNNINLHVSKGAIIKFSTNPKHYLPVVKVRWEGTVCYNYSPLIYAYQQKNIALTGEGVLDGQADQFWFAWKKQPDGNDQERDKKTLRDMGRDGVDEMKRIFGEGYKLRPTLIELYECENILIEGVTLQQSPFWTTHPVFSKNITIRNITINRGTTNDDGIDPDGCLNVLIENCVINTDDDPIAIKAGRDNDAWNRMQTKNIIIRNIKGSSKVGNGFCIGSEMSGGVENVFVEKYYIAKTPNGINIKSNLDRGGFIRNVYIRNFAVDSAITTGILMQKDYHSYRGGNYPPKYSGIYFQNITIGYVEKKGMRITGVAAQTIQNIWMGKLKIKKQGEADEIKFVEQVFINKKSRKPL
jgi:polygalacturonase